MTASVSQSTAILKIRYPEGKIPTPLYKKTPLISTVKKRTDFTGESRKVSLQNERPQGVSARFSYALGSLQQGNYVSMTINRLPHYALARITGEALKAAKGNEGALVDLWTNECDGVSEQELQCLETYAFGNGDGIIGQCSSYSSGTTITLASAGSAVNFCLGMRLQFVDATGLSPTLGVGTVTVTSILRGPNTATVTVDTAPSSVVTNITLASAYIVRAGDYASGGTGAVITGLQQIVAGGSSPGTLYGLNRNTDPVRLAGQTFDATGYSMDDAIIEASGMAAQQGANQPTTCWINVRDAANWRKSLMGRVTYPKTTVNGTMAGVSFTGVQIEGDNGPITVMTSPFCPRNKAFLLNMDGFVLDSLGPAPHLLDYDQNNFLRVSSDDAYECRFGLYGNFYTKMTADNVQITNFGV